MLSTTLDVYTKPAYSTSLFFLLFGPQNQGLLFTSYSPAPRSPLKLETLSHILLTDNLFFFFSKSKALIYHCESFSFSRNMFSWVSLIMALIADSELSLDLVNLWSCALWMRSLEKCNISVRRAGSSMKTRRKDDIEVTVTRDGAARPPARVVRL